MFRHKGLKSVALAIVASPLITGACGSSDTATDETIAEVTEETTAVAEESKGTVKIGVLTPLTGDVAADGQEMVDAVNLAVKRINEEGGACGYSFEVDVRDVQYERPDAVSSAVEKLTSDPDVHFVISGYASGTNFEIDLLAKAGMPYLIGAGSTQTRDIIAKDPSKYPTIWSLAPSYDGYNTELPKVIQQMIDEKRYVPRNKSIYVLTADNPYSTGISEGLKENFAKIGWTVAGEEAIATGKVEDWRIILSKIRKADPDLIINTDYTYQNGAMFVNQFMENPTDAMLFIQYAPQVPEFVDLTKGTSDGVLYNVLLATVPDSERAAFLKGEFKNAYGRDGGLYSVALQEGIELYKEAVCAVDPTDHLAIGEWIGKAEMESALGKIAFDPLTHLALQDADHMPILFYQIGANGERVLIWPDNYKDGDFRVPPHIGK
jgi:branched-chain amino acid transport system substrate-binding protein